MVNDQQIALRPRKSATGQLPSLTQHIEDGFQRGVVTGILLDDLSTAYNNICHKLLHTIYYKMPSELGLLTSLSKKPPA